MKWFFLALGPMLLFLSSKNQLPPSAKLHLQVQEVKAPWGSCVLRFMTVKRIF